MNTTTRTDAGAGGLADSLTSLFEATFGAAPAGVWAAPGRVNLIGEHTDYNEGFVLPFAIDKRATTAVRPRGDSTVRLLSTSGGEGIVDADIDRPGPRGPSPAGPSTRSAWSGRCSSAASRSPASISSSTPTSRSARGCPPRTPSNAPS